LEGVTAAHTKTDRGYFIGVGIVTGKEIFQGGLQVGQNAVMELAFGHAHQGLGAAYQAAAAREQVDCQGEITLFSEVMG
jgi:hypothetical protein